MTIAETITNAVAETTDTKGLLLTSRRKQNLVAARIILAKLLKDYTCMSEVEIGDYMNRNTASVHYYMQAFQDRLETEINFKLLYYLCRKEVESKLIVPS